MQFVGWSLGRKAKPESLTSPLDALHRASIAPLQLPVRLEASSHSRNTTRISDSLGAMPKILEVLLWCAALATWLTFLIGLIGEGLRPLWEGLLRLFRGAFKIKAK